MPGDRIMIDGLWRCLCPSIDLTLSSRPFNRFLLSPRHGTLKAQRQCRRTYAIAPFVSENREHAKAKRSEYLGRLLKRSAWAPEAVDGTDPLHTKLSRIPTDHLYTALKGLANGKDTYFAVTRLVEYLIKERGERHNLMLYQSLIKANVDSRYGSAMVASDLFREVRNLDLETTPEFYHTLLEVTAVHPDYVLRSHVLHEMKLRWFHLTPLAHVNVILSLLRDKQYELAFYKLETLNETPDAVPPWLFDVFLYTFGELGFHEETLAILKRCQRTGEFTGQSLPLSLSTWLFLLDVFSRDHFYAGITYIWGLVVAAGKLHPPDGVMLNILNTVSLNGDTSLAMEVIQALSDRGVLLGIHHYEALIHCHMQHEDVRKALVVLCIMTKAGHTPERAGTRPILQLICSSNAWLDKALDILQEISQEHSVPAAAFNVVLEAMSILQPAKCLDLYRGIRQICEQGPDLDTFKIMFTACKSPTQIYFLVAEMDLLGIRPSQRIVDLVVFNYSLQANHEPAFEYLEKIQDYIPPGSSKPLWLGRSGALALLRKCYEDQDPRFESIMKECHHRGIDVDTEVGLLMKGVDIRLPASLPTANGDNTNSSGLPSYA
ncbi:hypothetical protein F5Y16DRAFT_365543 [Xylariaceae sp. FL0255]|nr:hypothetical protein F5Y16DRAFT_365543 [Xylariaceae sp. FL0255]